MSNPIALKDLLENVLQKYRRWEDVRNRLRRLEEEFEFGRIDQSRYTELKNKYQEELEKIWDQTITTNLKNNHKTLTICRGKAMRIGRGL